MALELGLIPEFSRQQIRNSLLAGITPAAAQPDPVVLAAMLLAFQHQALAFGIQWPELLQDAATILPTRAGEWLLAVSQDKVLLDR